MAEERAVTSSLPAAEPGQPSAELVRAVADMVYARLRREFEVAQERQRQRRNGTGKDTQFGRTARR